MRVPRDRFGSSNNKGQIRFAVLTERRRHADGDDVGAADAVEMGACLKPTGLQHPPDAGRGDVPDVRLAEIQLVDLLAVDIEADDAKATLGDRARERKPHIAHPADGDDRALSSDPGPERAIARRPVVACRFSDRIRISNSHGVVTFQSYLRPRSRFPCRLAAAIYTAPS